MPNMADTDHPRAPHSSRRIGRKDLSSYLHKLFGQPDPTNVRPDYAFSDDQGRYHLEVYLNTPRRSCPLGPNLIHQNGTVSWLTSMPRSCSMSSTLRSDSGKRT